MNTTTTTTAKRTTDLIEFAKQLTTKVKNIQYDCGKCPRVIAILAPTSYGDIEVVMECKAWNNKMSMTYTASGEWTGLSYWTEGQI